MRKGIRQNGPRVAVYVDRSEEKIDERNGQKDQARYGKQEMRCCVQVAKPLRKGEAGCEQRILNTEDLSHTARPANALTDMRGEALCCQTRGLWNVDVSRTPAEPLHAQRGVSIFGHRLHCNSTDFVERAAAQNPARDGGTIRLHWELCGIARDFSRRDRGNRSDGVFAQGPIEHLEETNPTLF